MARLPTDWHPEDVKAAIRKTGITLTALALAHGLSESAVRQALRRRQPRAQGVIARHLGLPPRAIWPSRYDAQGRPLSGPRSIGTAGSTRAASTPHHQKSRAA